MRTTFYCFFLCCLAIISTGCQKNFELTDGAEPTGSKEEFRLKTYSEKLLVNGTEVNESVLLYDYDSKNQLKQIQSQAGDMLIEVSYPDRNEIFWTVSQDQELQLQVKFFKNNIGLIDSSFQVNSDNEKFTSKLIYNSAGRVIFLRDYEFISGIDAYVLVNITRFTYDAVDNLIKSEDDLGYVREMKYYDDIIGLIPESIPSAIPAAKGKLLKSRKIIVGGEVIDDVEITYTFDARNRISVMQEKALHTNVTAVKTYTYY